MSMLSSLKTKNTALSSTGTLNLARVRYNRLSNHVFRKRKAHGLILWSIFQVYFLANANPKSVLHALWLSKYLEESKFRFSNKTPQQQVQELIAMSNEKAASLWDSLAGVGWDINSSTLEDLCGPLTLYNMMEEAPTSS